MNILDFLTNGQASQLGTNGDGAQRLVANLMMQRSEWLRSLLDSSRNVDGDCGYPVGYIDPKLYWELYQREPIATRVVEVYPKESWQVNPQIFEDENVETITPFEEAWDALGKQLRGEQSFYQEEEASVVFDFLCDADIKCGIGHYAAILLGFDDGAPLDQPIDLIDAGKPAKASTASSSGAVRRLLFMQVYPETAVRINSLEADMQSPRYGLPTEYDISMMDPLEFSSLGVGTSLPSNRASVHWTRVVHISEYGVLHTPRQRPVLNRLLDLRKLYGGSAEMYWRGAFPGYAIKTQPQLGADVDINKEDVKQQLTDYSNALQRFLVLMGMDITALAPQVSDPSSQIDKQVEAICIQLGIPKRIFMGSERGELASSQDDAAWNDRLKQRQLGVITPRIIIPFVDRLIATRVLPRPAKGYRVSWPDLTSKSDEEKAGIATQRTQAIAAYVAGQLESTLAPMDFWTRIMGFTEDEAQSIIANAEEVKQQKEKEQAAKDAEAARVQAEAQARMDESARLAADATGTEQTATAPGSPTSPGKPFGGNGSQSPTSAPPNGSTGQPGGSSTVGNTDVGNAFCPTGPGGGVDPSCSPKPGESAASGGEVKHIAHDSRDLVKLREEVANFPAGPRREEAIQALKPSRHDVVIALRHEGSLVGVASVWKTPDTAEEGMPSGQYIRIRNMATAKAGTGKDLLNAIYHHAASQGVGVYLSSLSGSSRFYETSRFNPGVGSTWYLTASEVKSRLPTENFDSSLQSSTSPGKAPGQGGGSSPTQPSQSGTSVKPGGSTVGGDSTSPIAHSDPTLVADFDPSQARDSHGKWTKGAVESASAKAHEYIRENGPTSHDELAYHLVDEGVVDKHQDGVAMVRHLVDAGHLVAGSDEHGGDALHVPSQHDTASWKPAADTQAIIQRAHTASTAADRVSSTATDATSHRRAAEAHASAVMTVGDTAERLRSEKAPESEVTRYSDLLSYHAQMEARHRSQSVGWPARGVAPVNPEAARAASIPTSPKEPSGTKVSSTPAVPTHTAADLDRMSIQQMRQLAIKLGVRGAKSKGSRALREELLVRAVSESSGGLLGHSLSAEDISQIINSGELDVNTICGPDTDQG